MKNMTFRRLKKLNSNDPNEVGTSDSGEIYFPSSKSDSCRTTDSSKNYSDVYNYKTLAYSGGTLPRNFRKGGLQKWKPLTKSPELQRKVIVLEKEEEETFGFEIQTYGLHHQDENSVEMCTFVCKVHEGSPAHSAGLRVGDTIASVNEAVVEGCRHKDIVQLIRSSGNSIRLETVYSDSIRKAELEARLQFLKQTLHEKWEEYRSLMVQEQRLVHGIVMGDAAVYESLESARALVYGSLGAPSPAAVRALYCASSSASSSASRLSEAADDDPLYQTFVCQEEAEPRPARPVSALYPAPKTQLTRSASTRSYLRGAASSSSSSCSQGVAEKPSSLGSFPRKPKPKQMSFRRRLLKFIPGLNRALEEEESKL
ncbi:general receptor for phosphoinositides 1-associated scaffold protein [Anguilla rostrata]|uniref:general receptor for phosphoinositides 1-associated scaffold protein n=1 Tax=Anguilla rostrata TaxID=7938 RepID=UPI0030CD7CE2